MTFINTQFIVYQNLSLQAQCDQLTTQITKVMGSKYFESPSSTTNQPLYLTTDLHLEIIQKAESAEDHNLNLTKAMHDIVLKSHAINNVKAKLLSNLLEKHTFAMASQGLKQIAFNASNPAPKPVKSRYIFEYLTICQAISPIHWTMRMVAILFPADMARYRNQIIKLPQYGNCSANQKYIPREWLLSVVLLNSNRRKKLLSDLYNSLHRLLKLFNAGIERLIEGTKRTPSHLPRRPKLMLQASICNAPVPLSTSSQPSNTSRRPSGIR